MSRSIPWILLTLALALIGWMLYIDKPEDMDRHREKEAFQDTIHILRDSLSRVNRDIAVKSNTVDSTLSKIKTTLTTALKDRDRWRASYKATKAKLDTLQGDAYRQTADSLLTEAGQKIDTLYQKIGELTVDTEALTQQLKFERESRTRAVMLMQQQVDRFEERLTAVESDNDTLTKKNRRSKKALIAVGVIAFIGGMFVP